PLPAAHLTPDKTPSREPCHKLGPPNCRRRPCGAPGHNCSLAIMGYGSSMPTLISANNGDMRSALLMPSTNLGRTAPGTPIVTICPEQHRLDLGLVKLTRKYPPKKLLFKCLNYKPILSGRK
ncbi:hypothetical protein J0S82_010164, partial [Galemys pyrenaicus]